MRRPVPGRDEHGNCQCLRDLAASVGTHGPFLCASLLLGVLVWISALPASLVLPSANAGASGTVKARTQRMPAPNLTGQPLGWYEIGTNVPLVCATRGEAVRGYFSFNIPNGGWDDLWYRVSDGGYVADVDIDTGSLNPIVALC